MTTPVITSPVRDFVLKAVATNTAAQTLRIASASIPNPNPVYCTMPAGTNQVQVTWDGSCAVNVFYGPDMNWDLRRQVGTIPAGTRNTTRRFQFPIAADTESFVVFLQAVLTDPADLPYRAGVQIINTRIT